jgi:hypothetical protein
MTPSKWRLLSTTALGVSLAFLVLALTLPAVKLPQTVSHAGPSLPYLGSNTTLSGYFLPPVNRGDPIKISISNFTRDSIVVSMFPASPGNFAPLGPLLLQEVATGRNFTSTSLSPYTQSYALFVVSYNRTSFYLQIQSTWSPFYILNTYVVPAVFLVLITGAAAYYYFFAEKRWKSEQQVIRDATGH